MQAFRRIWNPRQILRATAMPTMRPAVRAMSLYEAREKGEEAKFVRAREEELKQQARANLERILAMENTSEEKIEILAQLAPTPEEKSFAERYGLDDWKFALPIGILLGMPTLANEVYVMNAETHVLVAFLIFIYTTYSQAGGIIAKSLDDQREAIHAQLKKVDEAVMADLKETIKATEKVMELEGDIKSIFAITDEMAVAQADMLNVAEEHKYNKAIQKKLDALLVLEETATHACTIRMKNAVTADVKTVFSQDKAAKDKALAQAIAVLAAGPNGKLGKDVVGEFFGSAVKKYRDDYMKKPAGSDEILNNLERDMKEIAAAPSAGEGGGNVYVTHPVMGHK